MSAILADLPSIEVRDSGTHGLGVYPLSSIAQGKLVITHRGILHRTHEIAADTRAMQVDHDLWLCQDHDNDSADNYLNHSCEPNIGFVDGTLSMFALREIAAGEELLWDYSTSMNEPGWRVECRCGTARCRGAIEAFSSLTHDVQERLRLIALRYLRELR